MRTPNLGPLLLSAALVAVGCGQQAATAAPATAAPAGTVTATLSDQAISLSQSSAPSGKVTFSAVNRGSVMHSLVLLKTDVPHERIPADPKDPSRVQETGSIAATGQIPVGEKRDFARDLAPGNYVLVCNEPAHYLVGMHVGFTVK